MMPDRFGGHVFCYGRKSVWENKTCAERNRGDIKKKGSGTFWDPGSIVSETMCLQAFL